MNVDKRSLESEQARFYGQQDIHPNENRKEHESLERETWCCPECGSWDVENISNLAHETILKCDDCKCEF